MKNYNILLNAAFLVISTVFVHGKITFDNFSTEKDSTISKTVRRLQGTYKSVHPGTFFTDLLQENENAHYINADKTAANHLKEENVRHKRSLDDNQLGWNCFDVAIGLSDLLGIQDADAKTKAENARQELVRRAVAESSKVEYRLLLAPEIRHAAALTASYLNSPQGTHQGIDFQLPSTMRNAELTNLANKYLNSLENDQMKTAFAKCNDAIGHPEGQRLNLDELLEFFKDPVNMQKYGNAYQQFNQVYESTVKVHEDAFQEYCSRESTYIQYIKDNYGKNGWFAFQRGVSGEKSTSMVDITAKLLQLDITIYFANNVIYSAEYGAQHSVSISYDGVSHFTMWIDQLKALSQKITKLRDPVGSIDNDLHRETLENAIKGVKNRLKYVELVNAHINKLGKNLDYSNCNNQLEFPRNKQLKDIVAEVLAISDKYYDETYSDREAFAKFSAFIDSLVEKFLAYDFSNPNFNWVLKRKEVNLLRFVIDALSNNAMYIETIRGKILRDSIDKIVSGLSDAKRLELAVVKHVSASQFKDIKVNLNVVDNIWSVLDGLVDGTLQPKNLNRASENIRRLTRPNNPMRVELLNNFEVISEAWRTKRHTVELKKRLIANLETIRLKFANLIESDLKELRLTIKEFHYLSIEDLQRLAIAGASERKTMEMIGYVEGMKIFSRIESSHGNEYGQSILKQNGNMIHKFQQIDLENMLDFQMKGHCLAYSILYMVNRICSGNTAVFQMFLRLNLNAHYYDKSRYILKSNLPAGPKESLKSKTDKYRAILDGIYGNYYVENSELDKLMAENRPHSYRDKSQSMPLPDILERIKTSNEGALIRTGNHALALNYDKTSKKFEFFDPNFGVFEYSNENHALDTLTDFFTKLETSYAVRIDRRLHKRNTIYLKADFLNKNLAEKVTQLAYNPHKLTIESAGLLGMTEKQQVAAAHALIAANENGRALVKEFPQVMQKSGMHEKHWIPDFNSAKELEGGKWQLTFVHDTDSTIKTVDIESPTLSRALSYLKRQGEKIKNSFSFEHGEIGPKIGIPDDVHISGMEGLNILGAIQMLFRNNQGDYKDLNTLSQGLEIFFWANAAQGVAQTAVDVVHTGLSVLSREGSLIGKSLSYLSKVSKGIGALGILGMGAAGVLDSYELGLAINNRDDVAIPGSVTNLVFDGVSLGLGMTSLVAGGTVGAFSGALMVPVGGLAIGVTALVNQNSGNTQQCLAAAKYLYSIGMAYENGGYFLSKDGAMVPYFGAAISEIDLVKKTVTFGKTEIPENKVPEDRGGIHWILGWMESPTILDSLLDWREAWGVSQTVTLKDVSHIIVLPVTGNSKFSYSWNYIAGITERGDFELKRLDKLFYDSKHRFAFRHKVAWAFQAFHQNYQNTDIKVVLDSSNRRLYIPSRSDYPKNIGHRGGEGPYFYEGNWQMTYILEGNGGNYVISVGNSWSKVVLKEQGNSKSTWVIHPDGKDVGDDIADVQSLSDGKLSLRIGGVSITVESPNQSKLLVHKKNGEIWKYDLIAKNSHLVEVDKSWVQNHLNNLTESLAYLAKLRKVEQISLPDVSSTTSNTQTVHVSMLRDIYIAKTHQLLGEDEQGSIYEMQNKTKIFWGVGPKWKLRYDEKNIIEELEKLAKATKKDVIHMLGMQMRIPNTHQTVSVLQYIAGSNQLLGFSEDGKVYQFSESQIPKLVALSQNWFTKIVGSSSLLTDKEIEQIVNYFGRSSGINGVNLQQSQSVPPKLEKYFNIGQTFVKEIEKLVESEPSVALITITGVRGMDNTSFHHNCAVPVWYDVNNKQFIAVGGLPCRHIELIGQGDGFFWLFDKQNGQIYAQFPLDNAAKGIFQLAPFAILCFSKLGKITGVTPGNDKLFATNSNDMTFTIRGMADATLVKVGEKCAFTWDYIENEVNSGYYRLADVVYTYAKASQQYPQGDKYWYSSSLRKTKFRPTNSMTKDISKYEYVGQSLKENKIFLYDREGEILYTVTINGDSSGLAVNDVIRIDRVVTFNGLLLAGGKTNGDANSYMLPEMDNIQTIVLRNIDEDSLGINWSNNSDYSRVTIDVFSEGFYNRVNSNLKIQLKGVTMTDFRDKLKFDRSGDDNIELTDGVKFLVFGGSFQHGIKKTWNLQMLAENNNYIDVRVLDAIRKKRKLCSGSN